MGRLRCRARRAGATAPGVAHATGRRPILDPASTRRARASDPRGDVGTHLGADVGADARAYGVGDPFQFALLSVETIVQLEDGRYLTALDNNFPGDDGRYRGKPDDTEMIIFSVK